MQAFEATVREAVQPHVHMFVLRWRSLKPGRVVGGAGDST